MNESHHYFPSLPASTSISMKKSPDSNERVRMNGTRREERRQNRLGGRGVRSSSDGEKEIRMGTAPMSIDGPVAELTSRGEQNMRLLPLIVHWEEKSPLLGVARGFNGKEARKEFRREARSHTWFGGVCFDGRRRYMREVRLLSQWLTEAPLRPMFMTDDKETYRKSRKKGDQR
ncbi:unnamed protein product [Lactuca saligna]|uniref:Uncharacterized protein n=1 Tax=Lactuca saligna TaxID=75948 RepID=A0AA35V4M3_LACSI|nr:unnamed protein product [Lactuca saligna]